MAIINGWSLLMQGDLFRWYLKILWWQQCWWWWRCLCGQFARGVPSCSGESRRTDDELLREDPLSSFWSHKSHRNVVTQTQVWHSVYMTDLLLEGGWSRGTPVQRTGPKAGQRQACSPISLQPTFCLCARLFHSPLILLISCTIQILNCSSMILVLCPNYETDFPFCLWSWWVFR